MSALRSRVRLGSKAPLSEQELRSKVHELKNVELPEKKDWDDDLKASCATCTSVESGQ